MDAELLGDELREVRTIRVVADDEGNDSFPQVVVGQTHDSRLADRRMGEQRVLDFAGADAVAAALDEVDRHASDDAEPSVVLFDHRIAGRQEQMFMLGEFVYTGTTGAANINVVFVTTGSGGTSTAYGAATAPSIVIVDELVS